MKWQVLFLVFLSAPLYAQQGFVPDAPFVGQVYGSYIDPEFSAGACQVVFQDSQNRLWIGDIDPETGLFKTATGRDYLMDSNIIPVFDSPPKKWSTNGPEWTRDDKGYCVVYTKTDTAGIMQQWLARLVNSRSQVEQVTRQSFDCYGNMPSRYEDGKPPRIAFTYNWPIWKAQAAWVFADAPDSLHTVPYFDYRSMSMWSPVSPDFLFVHQPPGAAYGQIARSNAETGAMKVLTNDTGQKNDPGFFRAPEFGGDICLLANVDNSALAVYRDLGAPDGFWTRIATLRLPADAPYAYISSPEVLAPETGINGISYFALLARQASDRNTPGGIWIFGLGTDSTRRIVRRIDDGALTGSSAVRLEPEPFVGKRETFVYYNFHNPATGEYGFRRARTGITVATTSIAEEEKNATHPVEFDLMQNYPNPFTSTTTIRYSIGRAAFVSLKVHDMLGREVSTLVHDWKDPGSYSARLLMDERNMRPGMYVYQLRSGASVESRTMVMAR